MHRLETAFKAVRINGWLQHQRYVTWLRVPSAGKALLGLRLCDSGLIVGMHRRGCLIKIRYWYTQPGLPFKMGNVQNSAIDFIRRLCVPGG